jgi:PhnB protein
MASTSVRPVPPGYHTVTPYLIVQGAEKAIEFYKKAFNAKELLRLPMPDGKGLAHAEVQIGDSHVMLADESPQMKTHAPKGEDTSLGIALYVEDCDALFKQAVTAGAKVTSELKDQFYGDRSGTVLDPFGYKWTVASHKEDVPPEEMKKRMAQMARA